MGRTSMGSSGGKGGKSRPHSASSSRRPKFGGSSPGVVTSRFGGSARAQAPDRRVFVGNLGYKTSWQDLKDHMRQCGNVVQADILSGPDGRSKGCGIVEYSHPNDARRAIRELNESDLDGRTIFLREDREAGGSGRGRGRDGGGGGSRGNTGRDGGGSGCTVFVGNLSWDAKWQDLKDHMRQGGNVVNVEVLENRDGRSKGCAVVEYSSARDADRALRELDGTTLMGRELFVQTDDRDRGGGRGGGGGHDEQDCCLFVGNLRYETSWQDLKDFMRKAGNVARADILQGPDGRSKGCGTVEYEHPEDAARALRELNEETLDGRTVYIQQDRGPDSSRGGGGGQQDRRTDASRGRGGGQQDREMDLGMDRGLNTSRGGGGGGGGGGNNGCQLYVGNLSFDTRWQSLKDYFKQCGDVDRAEVIEVDGRSKGFGTIRFFNERDADEAIRRLDGTELDGRRLHVRIDNQA